MDNALYSWSRHQREETEGQIEQHSRYLVLMDNENYRKVLNISDIEPIAVERKYSIRLYLLIISLEALHELRRLLNSGRLKVIFEKLFNSWLINIQSNPVESQSMIDIPSIPVDSQTTEVQSRPVDSQTTKNQFKPVQLTHLSLIDYCQSKDCFEGTLTVAYLSYFLILLLQNKTGKGLFLISLKCFGLYS